MAIVQEFQAKYELIDGTNSEIRVFLKSREIKKKFGRARFKKPILQKFS